jgi:hypothetical protein
MLRYIIFCIAIFGDLLASAGHVSPDEGIAPLFQAKMRGIGWVPAESKLGEQNYRDAL